MRCVSATIGSSTSSAAGSPAGSPRCGTSSNRDHLLPGSGADVNQAISLGRQTGNQPRLCTGSPVTLWEMRAGRELPGIAVIRWLLPPNVAAGGSRCVNGGAGPDGDLVGVGLHSDLDSLAGARKPTWIFCLPIMIARAHRHPPGDNQRVVSRHVARSIRVGSRPAAGPGGLPGRWLRTCRETRHRRR
jgi:hypothetical protein